MVVTRIKPATDENPGKKVLKSRQQEKRNDKFCVSCGGGGGGSAAPQAGQVATLPRLISLAESLPCPRHQIGTLITFLLPPSRPEVWRCHEASLRHAYSRGHSQAVSRGPLAPVPAACGDEWKLPLVRTIFCFLLTSRPYPKTELYFHPDRQCVATSNCEETAITHAKHKQTCIRTHTCTNIHVYAHKTCKNTQTLTYISTRTCTLSPYEPFGSDMKFYKTFVN